MRWEIMSTATPAARCSSTTSSSRCGGRLRERARRLVEDQQPGVGRDRARDLHLLLHLDAELVDDRRRLRRARRGGRAPRVGLAAQAPPVDAPAAPGQPAEEDVLRDGQRRRERQLLADRDDPEPQRRARVRDPLPASPSTMIVPGVRLHRAVDDARERRLARAVLARERVHLARARSVRSTSLSATTPGNALVIPRSSSRGAGAVCQAARSTILFPSSRRRPTVVRRRYSTRAP